MFQWAIAFGWPQNTKNRLMPDAAGGGHLEVVKWLREQGYAWTNDVCSAAATNGSLEVLMTCESAIRSRELYVLKWVRKNGCPWGEQTCCTAAQMGELEMLKWARDNGCPCDEVCRSAALYDRLHVLKWLRKHGWPCEGISSVLNETPTEIQEWAKKEGLEYDRKLNKRLIVVITCFSIQNGRMKLWRHQVVGLVAWLSRRVATNAQSKNCCSWN